MPLLHHTEVDFLPDPREATVHQGFKLCTFNCLFVRSAFRLHYAQKTPLLHLGMGAMDFMRSRQLSRQLLATKICQVNGQGNFFSSKNFSRQLLGQLIGQINGQINCQVNYVITKNLKSIVKSIK